MSDQPTAHEFSRWYMTREQRRGLRLIYEQDQSRFVPCPWPTPDGDLPHCYEFECAFGMDLWIRGEDSGHWHDCLILTHTEPTWDAAEAWLRAPGVAVVPFAMGLCAVTVERWGYGED